MPPAEIIPFPGSRRVHFVRRAAVRMAELTPAAAERHLARTIDVQRQAMCRKGVAPELVAEELQALDGAIRVALWRAVLTPDSPGGAA